MGKKIKFKEARRRQTENAVCALLKDHADSEDPPSPSYRPAAEIIAYCMIGADGFGGTNAAELAHAVERRIEAALVAGDSLDAQLVLLTLHARVIQPSVIARFDLESGIPMTLPAFAAVPVYPVSVRDDGVVVVEVLDDA